MGWKKGRFSSVRRGFTAFVGLLLGVLMVTCPALGQQPAGLAHDDSVFVQECVTDADRKAASQGGKHEAFRQSTIPLGPFYWASADRELVQTMMVYWRILDVQEDTRLTLFLPLYVDHCAPDARTWIGPFGGWGGQTDAEGTAGWWGPYFFRRDEERASDVLFPFIWSFRDAEEETNVLGPFFSAKRPGTRLFGLAPLYLGYRSETEGFFDIAPGFARWGSGPDKTSILLQTWSKTTATTDTTFSVPFWFSHEDRSDDSYVQAAPGFARWGEGEEHTTLIGSWLSRQSPHGDEHGLLPLYVSGEVKDPRHGGLASLLGVRPDEPYRYTLIPPLLYGHTETATRSITWWAQSRIEHGPERDTVASAPFFFQRRSKLTAESDYTVIPPLAYLWVKDKEEGGSESLLAGPYFSVENAQGKTHGLLPAYVSSRTTTGDYLDIVPALAWARFGDEESQTDIVAQTAYVRGPEGWDLWSVPFVFAGQVGDGEEASDYLLIPPLAFGRSAGKDYTNIVAGPSWWFNNANRWSGGVFPLYAGGRHRDVKGKLHASWDALPLLATYRSFDEDGSSLVVGPFYDFRTPSNHERGLLGVWHSAEIGNAYDSGLPTFGSKPQRYWVAPPLLSGHYEDEDRSLRVIAGYYRYRGAGGLFRGLAPFLFSGRGTHGDYFDAAPLGLAARWGDRDESHLWLGQTYGFSNEQTGAWHLTSLPFGSAGQAADGRHHLVAPLMGVLASGDRNREQLLAFNTLYSRSRVEETGGQNHLLLSVPFYLAIRQSSGERVDVIPPLALASWGDKTSANLLAGPWFDFEDERGRDRGVLGVFAAGASSEGQGATPLLALTRAAVPDFVGDLVLGVDDDEARAYTIAPGYLHAEKGTTSTTVIGQSYYRQTENAELFGSLPFYLGARADDGSALDLIPPLAFARWSDGERKVLWAGPWLQMERPTAEGTGRRSWFVLAPIAYGYQAPNEHGLLTPAFARWGSDETEQLWAGQTWARWTQEDWSLWSVPLYFGAGQADGSAYTHIIPPLATLLWKTPERQVHLVTGYVDVEDDQGSDQGFFPFYVSGASKAGHTSTPLVDLAKTVVPDPFEDVLHLQPKDSLSYTVAPGYLRFQSDENRAYVVGQSFWLGDDQNSRFGSLPFYFGTRHEEGSYVDLAPPAMFARWSDGSRRLFWLGPYGQWDNDGEDDHWVGLAPLFIGHRSADRNFLLTPAGGSWGNDEVQNLWVAQTWGRFHEEGWSAASVPFYFGWRDKASEADLIPPLMFARWQSEKRSVLWAGPWASYRDDAAKESIFGLAPLFVGVRDQQQTSLYTPLGAGWSGEEETGFWLGQTYATWGAEAWKVWSVPFYFGGSGSGLDGTAAAKAGGYHLVPLLAFGRWWDGEGNHVDVTGPMYDVKLGSKEYRGLLPLYASGADAGGGFLLAPGVWHRWRERRQQRKTWVAQTNVETSDDGWLVASHPFYYGRVDEPSGKYHHTVPLALSFIWGQENEDISDHNLVIGPLLSLENKTGRDRALLPLWLSGEGTATPLSPMVAELSESLLGEEAGLVFQQPQGFSYAVGPGFFHAADQDGERRVALVGQTLVYSSAQQWKAWSAPFYFGAGDDKSRYHLVPPLLSGHAADEEAGEHTTVIAPLAYADWVARGRHTTLVGPYFNSRDDDGHFRGVAPFWMDQKSKDGFLQMYSPLVWRWGDGETSRMLGPGLWHSKGKDSSDLIVFPFFWDIERPSFDVTVAGGVYWRFGWRKDQAKGGRSLILAPGYARYDDDEETLHVAGPVAWSKGKGSHQEAWSMHLGPALSLYSYHRDHFRWKALMGVLGYEREGDKEQYTVFFVKTPARD